MSSDFSISRQESPRPSLSELEEELDAHTPPTEKEKGPPGCFQKLLSVLGGCYFSISFRTRDERNTSRSLFSKIKDGITQFFSYFKSRSKEPLVFTALIPIPEETPGISETDSRKSIAKKINQIEELAQHSSKTRLEEPIDERSSSYIRTPESLEAPEIDPKKLISGKSAKHPEKMTVTARSFASILGEEGVKELQSVLDIPRDEELQGQEDLNVDSNLLSQNSSPLETERLLTSYALTEDQINKLQGGETVVVTSKDSSNVPTFTAYQLVQDKNFIPGVAANYYSQPKIARYFLPQCTGIVEGSIKNIPPQNDNKKTISASSASYSFEATTPGLFKITYSDTLEITSELTQMKDKGSMVSFHQQVPSYYVKKIQGNLHAIPVQEGHLVRYEISIDLLPGVIKTLLPNWVLSNQAENILNNIVNYESILASA